VQALEGQHWPASFGFGKMQTRLVEAHCRRQTNDDDLQTDPTLAYGAVDAAVKLARGESLSTTETSTMVSRNTASCLNGCCRSK